MVETTFARYSYLADDDSTLHYSSDESASMSDAYFQPASLSDSYFHPAAARVVSPPMSYSPEDSHHKGADDYWPQMSHLSPFPVPRSFSSQSNHGFVDKLSDRSVCSEESPLNLFYKRELSRSIREEYPQQILNSDSQDDDEEEQQQQQQQQPQRNNTTKQMTHQERRRYQRHVRMEHQLRELRVRQVRGKPQGETRQDSVWVMVLFLLQLAVILVCAVMWGSTVLRFRTGGHADLRPRMLLVAEDDVIAAEAFKLAQESNQRPLSVDCWAVLSMCAFCGIYSFIISTLTVGFMLIIGKSLIQTALGFSILLALSWGLIGMSIQPFLVVIPTLAFISLLCTLSYTLWVWDRIPFAATNLYVALCAMRCTADLTLMGMTMMLVSLGWCLLWVTALIGIEQRVNVTPNVSIALYILLSCSFVWTNLVIKNIVQVTVASVVGQWWFQPDSISPCCTSAVMKPLWRCMTKSFASICLGSLVTLPAQACHAVAGLFCLRLTSSKEGCWSLGGTVAQILRSCNRWGFTYVGLYGYSFNEGGSKALELFETREWMSVVNDDLIPNVLLMASVVIGGSAGIFGVLVEEVDGYTFTSLHKPIITAFLLGGIEGFVFSNIMLLGVVGSAVNTILVCFAAGPFEFDKNHPQLSREMRDMWSQQVWETDS